MGQRRLLKWIGCLLAGFFVFGMLPITVGTERRYTCTQCRAERIDETFFGVPWKVDRDTRFSEWYRSHRPAHTHTWGWQGTVRGMSLFGLTTYFGCGSRHPVCAVPEEALQEYCEQADESKLDAYFAGITSPDPAVQERTVQAVLDAIDPPK
jgi:hypothetical protein